MSLYSTVVFLHVATAILGLGPLTVLAVVTSRPTPAAVPWTRVGQFLRLVGWSLGGMFVTGAIIIALTRGALGETGWMRTSFGLFILLGALQGIARRQLRKILSAASQTLSTKPLNTVLWAMCVVTAAITYLMEAKPW
jgi:hypothetical protein